MVGGGAGDALTGFHTETVKTSTFTVPRRYVNLEFLSTGAQGMVV